MTTRRNFLKNTALTTAAITIPGTAIASVDNWAKMEPKYDYWKKMEPKFYSPLYTPSNYRPLEDIEKARIEFINRFDIPNLCTDIIDGKPIIIPEEYYIDDEQWAITKYGVEKRIVKRKSYAFMSKKFPHNIISLKEHNEAVNRSTVYIPAFVIAVKEKNASFAFKKINKFIRQEINSCLDKTWDGYAKLVISQSFNKYDMVFWRDGEYEQDGVQSIDHMVENHKSEFYAMRIGIVGFNADKTIS